MTKKDKKRVLGRGLDALIPTGIEDDIYNTINERKIENLDIDEVFANSLQPRKTFDSEEISNLTQSIKINGVLQPILVRKVKNGYEIIAGERRWRSSKNAKLKTIPAIIMDLDEEKQYEIALIENIQRTDLNTIEEALAYRTLIEKYGITQDEVGKRVGKSRAYVTNTLRLLNLNENIQELLIEKKISVGHAKILVSLPEKRQNDYAKIIIKENLSVRDLEKIINSKSGDEKIKKKKINTDEKYYDIERELSEKYGTKVIIKDNSKKGTITIEFYNQNDFNRIYDIIKK